jgi:hypothetical protein
LLSAFEPDLRLVQGLDGAMDSLQRLFTGAHDGKLLSQCSPEP